MGDRGKPDNGGRESIAVSGAAWQLRSISSAAAKTSLSVPEPRAGASWAARACGRLVATLQGFASHRATTCSAKRSAVPASASPTPAGVTTAATAFFQLATTAAATRTQSHGDVGASDPAAEAASASDLWGDAASSTKPAAHGRNSHPRPAGHAAPAARTDHWFSALQEHVFTAGEGYDARGYTPAPGRSRRRSRRAIASRAAIKQSLAFAGYPCQTAGYFRRRFLTMNNAFAGRSPSRRMRYGYHSVPNGT